MPKRSPRKTRRKIISEIPAADMLISDSQKQLLAEILGNVAVAWFTIGVISPLFLADPKPDRIFASGLAGILLSVVFILISLSIIGKK